MIYMLKIRKIWELYFVISMFYNVQNQTMSVNIYIDVLVTSHASFVLRINIILLNVKLQKD